MSMQVPRIAAQQDVAEVSAVQPRSRALSSGVPSAPRLHSVEGVTVDALPSRPPAEVLDQIDAAAARYQELHAQKRELHFKHDETVNRVVVEVRDLEGTVLRTVPPSKALDIIAGGTVD